MSAADLIYPLRMEQDALQRYLRRLDPRTDQRRGRVVVETIHTLNRAEKIARDLTPFNPAGL